jgi:hypothetical protein
MEERITYTRRVNGYLGDNYTAVPAEMKIFLFRSQERCAEGSTGWERLCLGDLAIIGLPGKHDTLFEPPAVAILTSSVDRILSSGHS